LRAVDKLLPAAFSFYAKLDILSNNDKNILINDKNILIKANKYYILLTGWMRGTRLALLKYGTKFVKRIFSDCFHILPAIL